MKRFTQKFFLLTIGMILSVGAFAQVEHRYPEVTYKIGTKTYKLPAWDVQMGTTYQFRIQALEEPSGDTNKHIPGKIVGRRAFTIDKISDGFGDYFFTAMQNASTEYSITITNFNGVEETKYRDLWTYADVFGVKGQFNEQGEEGIMDTEGGAKGIFKGETYTASDLSIPSTHLTEGNTRWTGYTFDIVQIGVAAFRNFNSSSFNILNVTGTLTIPASVKEIEHDAFRNCPCKHVVFAEGSQLQTIGRAAFAGCGKLEDINVPASVTTIEGLALGGCASLKKVTFEGSSVPHFTEEIQEPNYGSSNGGPYNIFENTQRFLKTGASTANVTPSKCIIEVPLHSVTDYINNEDGLDLTEFPMMSKLQFPENLSLISYCSERECTFKQYDTASPTWNDGALKVYYVNKNNVDVDNGKVTLTEITEAKKIPSTNFGVILSGTAGETYEIFYPNNRMSESLQVENSFKGVVENTTITIDEDNLYFVLSNGKFLPVKKSGKLSAYKAYLMIENDGDITVPISGAPELTVTLPEETGITTHEVLRSQDDVYYTLQGIQVKQPQKGIVIKNGKKFVIK